MSTRARIGIVRPDNSILSSYTHYDGYLSHHGPLLLNHYNTTAKVLALLAQGDCSSLDESLEDCIFYARDRNEPAADNAARKNNTVARFYGRARQCNAEYIYLFNQDKWFVSEVDDQINANWKDLHLALLTERLTS